jgi:hypothetical protein
MKFQKIKNGNFTAAFFYEVGEFPLAFEISVNKRKGPLLKVWGGENYLEYSFGLGKRAVDKFALFGANFIQLSLLCKFLEEKDVSQALAKPETTTKKENRGNGQGI